MARGDLPINHGDETRPITSSGVGVRAGESVGALVESGLPLESGLRALAEEAPTARLRSTLRTMSDELATGKSADDVLSGGRGGMPRYVRGLVKSGVQTGQLGAFLEEFLLILRRRRAAKQRFWMALLYPLLLLPITLLAASVALQYIVPKFKDIFYDFGIELPWLTNVLIAFCDWVTIPVISFAFLIMILTPLALRVLPPILFGSATWTRMVQWLPLIGTPARMRGMSEFSSLLGLLVSGGLPLPEALGVTAEVIEDPNLKAGTRKLVSRVSGGESLRSASAALPHFSMELQSLFHWETRGPAFGDLLRQAGHVFAARSNVQLGLVGFFFQPLLLFIVGAVLGFTVIALFLPLMNLLRELS